jgi:hypothetical protein
LGAELISEGLELTYLGQFQEDRIQSYYAGIPGKVIHHKYETTLPEHLYQEKYILVKDDRTLTFEWVDVV